MFQEGMYGAAEDGTSGLKLFGNLVFTGGIFVVVLQMAAIIQYWNICVHVLVWGALFVYMGIFGIESIIPSLFPSQYYQFVELFSKVQTYLYLWLVVFVCVGTEVAFRYWGHQYHPKDYHIIKEREKLEMGDGGEEREKVALNDYRPFVGDTDGAVMMPAGGWGEEEGEEERQRRKSKRASVFDMSTYSYRFGGEGEGEGEERRGAEVEEEEVVLNLGRRSGFPGMGGGGGCEGGVC